MIKKNENYKNNKNNKISRYDPNNKNENKNDNTKKNNEVFETQKTNFISILSQKAKELKEKDLLLFKKENININIEKLGDKNEKNNISKDSTDKIQKKSIKISFESNKKLSENSQTKTDDSLSKTEEYKLLNYYNILPIIQNNAFIEEEDLLEGKVTNQKLENISKLF